MCQNWVRDKVKLQSCRAKAFILFTLLRHWLQMKPTCSDVTDWRMIMDQLMSEDGAQTHSYMFVNVMKAHTLSRLPSSGRAGCVSAGPDAHLCKHRRTHTHEYTDTVSSRRGIDPVCLQHAQGLFLHLHKRRTISSYLLLRFESGGHDGASLSTTQMGVFTALGRLERLEKKTAEKLFFCSHY